MAKTVTGEEFVLNYLALHSSPIFPKELSESMETSTARVAAILRHLEKQKLVEVRDDEHDARRHSIKFSEEGRALVYKIRGGKLRLLEEIFSRLGEAETAGYIRLTQRIIDICSELGGSS